MKNEKEMELSEKDKKVQEISTVLRNHEAESKNLKKGFILKIYFIFSTML